MISFNTPSETLQCKCKSSIMILSFYDKCHGYKIQILLIMKLFEIAIKIELVKYINYIIMIVKCQLELSK